jgi:hypothetical protein
LPIGPGAAQVESDQQGEDRHATALA